MEPAAGGRHCALCQRSVHDLSALTRAEAEALLAQSGGGLCVRVVRDPEGRIVTRSAGESRSPGGAPGSFGRRLFGAVSLLAAACGAGEPDREAAAHPGGALASVAPPATTQGDALSAAENERIRQQLSQLGYVADEVEGSVEAIPAPLAEQQGRLFEQLGGTGYVVDDAPSAEPGPRPGSAPDGGTK